MYTEETLSILDEIEDLIIEKLKKHLNKMMKHIYCIKLF